MIQSNSILEPYVQRKWEETLQSNSHFEWKRIWSFNLRAIKENRIIEFNYKVLHDLIPHKYNLHKWKLCNNPICTFDGELHDCIHLFVKCKHTKLFWSRFSHIVKKIYGIDFSFDEIILIIGYDLENKKLNELNCLINYAKYAVYTTYIQSENRKLLLMI